MATGWFNTPLLAMVPYATAISNGLTPLVSPPKAMAGLLSVYGPSSTNDVIPHAFAIRMTLSVPTRNATRIAGML